MKEANITEEINEIVNPFIEQWCGSNAQHLLDTDENDGEDLRWEIFCLVQKYRSSNTKDRELKIEAYTDCLAIVKELQPLQEKELDEFRANYFHDAVNKIEELRWKVGKYD